jgi:hypothetical protein
MARSDDVLMSSTSGFRICLARFLGVRAWDRDDEGSRFRSFKVNNTKLCDADLPGVKTPGSVLKSLRDKKPQRGSTNSAPDQTRSRRFEDDDEYD